jgi:uncharacterized CHY-type Zn-finger protein
LGGLFSSTLVINGGVLNISQKKNVKKLDILVFRVTKEGSAANARPCYNCLNMMKNVGIRKVFYSTGNEDEVICEHVKNMISIQASSVTRLLDNKKKVFNDKDTYYISLLKNYFPEQVKYKNLEYFINHNFKNIFPHYNIVINNNLVYIYNDKNDIIIKSYLEI